VTSGTKLATEIGARRPARVSQRRQVRPQPDAVLAEYERRLRATQVLQLRSEMVLGRPLTCGFSV